MKALSAHLAKKIVYRGRFWIIHGPVESLPDLSGAAPNQQAHHQSAQAEPGQCSREYCLRWVQTGTHSVRTGRQMNTAHQVIGPQLRRLSIDCHAPPDDACRLTTTQSRCPTGFSKQCVWDHTIHIEPAPPWLPSRLSGAELLPRSTPLDADPKSSAARSPTPPHPLPHYAIGRTNRREATLFEIDQRQRPVGKAVACTSSTVRTSCPASLAPSQNAGVHQTRLPDRKRNPNAPLHHVPSRASNGSWSIT